MKIKVKVSGLCNIYDPIRYLVSHILWYVLHKVVLTFPSLFGFRGFEMFLPPSAWNSVREKFTVNDGHSGIYSERLPVNFAPNQCRRRLLYSVRPWWLRDVERTLANLPSHKL